MRWYFHVERAEGGYFHAREDLKESVFMHNLDFLHNCMYRIWQNRARKPYFDSVIDLFVISSKRANRQLFYSLQFCLFFSAVFEEMNMQKSSFVNICM